MSNVNIEIEFMYCDRVIGTLILNANYIPIHVKLPNIREVISYNTFICQYKDTYVCRQIQSYVQTKQQPKPL